MRSCEAKSQEGEGDRGQKREEDRERGAAGTSATGPDRDHDPRAASTPGEEVGRGPDLQEEAVGAVCRDIGA